MYIHTLCIDIAMQRLQRIVYPQSSSVQFVVGKKSFLDSLGVNTFSAVKICRFLHLVKEVSGAYNLPIVFLLGLWGGCQTALQSFNTLLPALERPLKSPEKVGYNLPLPGRNTPLLLPIA